MSKLPQSVDCIAFEASPGRYRAICLDFSLIAESSISVLDAQNCLLAQIKDYVDDIVDAGYPSHLVNRGLSRIERLSLRLTLARLGVRAFIAALVAALCPSPSEIGERAAWRQPITFAAA